MAKRRPSGDGMVRKKEDGRWEGRIVVGHKANGAPIFRYVYGRTQKELLSKLHQSIETYQDVELTEDSRMTLGEWLDRWLDEYKAGTIRHSTMYGYRQYARLYIKPILGDKVISRITSTDIQRMYTKLKREGRIHEHPEYGYQLSDAMLSRIHAMLHQAMKDAVGAHLIAKNPTEGTVVPKPNYRPKQILNEEHIPAGQHGPAAAGAEENCHQRLDISQSLASGGSSQSWLCLQSDENDPEKYRPTKY